MSSRNVTQRIIKEDKKLGGGVRLGEVEGVLGVNMIKIYYIKLSKN